MFNFLRSLFSSSALTTEPFDPGTGTFNLPDADAVKSKLQLHKRAKELGKQNQPPTEQTTKDSMASEIDLTLDTIFQRGAATFEARLAAIDEVGEERPTSFSQKMRDTVQQTLEDLYAACKVSVGELWIIRRDYCLADQFFEEFRTKNRLRRPADYPDNLRRLIGFLFIIFVGEVLLNAYTLGDAHPDGFLGVVLETFLISTINIGLGVIIGFVFLREISHLSPTRTLIGVLLTIGFGLGLVAFNVFIGHYRDVLLTTQTIAGSSTRDYLEAIGQTGASARIAFLEAPWDMQGLKSYLTTIIGLLLATFATAEAFKLDDRYPGYGRHHRKREELSTTYNGFHDQVYQEIKDIADRGRLGLNDIQAEAQAVWQGGSTHNRDRDRLITGYRNWIIGIGKLGKALYAEYREIARAVRTEPAPICFDIEYKSPDPVIGASGNPSTNIEGIDLIQLGALQKTQTERIDDKVSGYQQIYDDINALAPETAVGKDAPDFTGRVDKVHDDD